MPSVAFGRSVLKTGRPGTAVAKAHYVSREQSYGPGERKVHYIDRTEQYRVRDDLVHAEPPRNLPSWAPDAATFFGVAEREERANGVVLIEYKLSLPRALDTGQQLELVRDFVDLHLPHNPSVWALHEPPGLNAETHPHVHILASPRELDGVERGPAQFFRRYNAAHPEKGGARKSVALNQWNAIGREKQVVSDLCNVYLERAGSPVRSHPASLEARGFPVGAEPKLLPSDSFAYHSRGEVTTGMQKLLDHRAKMAPYRHEELRDAQQYWLERSVQLELHPAYTLDQVLARLAAGRQHALSHAPQKMSTLERQHQGEQAQGFIRALETHVGQLGDERYLEAEHSTKGTQRSHTSAQRVEQLLAVQPDALRPVHPRERAAAIREQTRQRPPARDLTQELELQTGGRLRGRLDRGRGRDQGMDVGF